MGDRDSKDLNLFIDSGVVFDNADCGETSYTSSPMGDTRNLDLTPSLASLLACPKKSVSGLLKGCKTTRFNPPKCTRLVGDDGYLGMPVSLGSLP